MDKATEMFRAVLHHEPNNLFAANGIGVVCVLKGRLQEGRVGRGHCELVAVRVCGRTRVRVYIGVENYFHCSLLTIHYLPLAACCRRLVRSSVRLGKRAATDPM